MSEEMISRKGVAYIVIATLGFSLIPILAQMGLSTDLKAATLLFYRFFIATLLFLIYCLATKKSLRLRNRKEYFYVAVAGCIYCVQCIFFFSSFQYISSSLGEIIYHCYPLFILVLANLFLKESITRNKVFGVILSVIGVFIVLYAPWGAHEIRGIVYVVVTAFVSSVYMVYTKKRVSDIDTTVLTMYLCLVCSVLYLAYSIIKGEFAVLQTYQIIINVCILSVCSTVIGFFSFMKAISLLKVGQVSILSLLEPIFTIIIAFLLLGVQLTSLQMIGTAVVLLAIYVYERPEKRNLDVPKEPPESL